MLVKEFMTTPVVSCKETDTVEIAAETMSTNGFSALPITNSNDELIGIITETDFMGKQEDIPHALVSIKRIFGQNFHMGDIEPLYLKAKKKTLGEVMTKKVTTVTSDSDLTGLIQLMATKNLKRVPVVDDGKLVGMITRKNLLYAFNKVK